MPRKCTICVHRKKFYINRSILSGKKSLRQIASQYGVNYAAVRWHQRKHLIPAMKLAQQNGEFQEGNTGLQQFNDMLEKAKQMFENSEKQLQVAWFREWRGMLELAFKLGILEERRREQQVYQDMTPGVKAIIDKEFGTLGPTTADDKPPGQSTE